MANQKTNQMHVLPIEGIPQYFISDTGVVYSRKVSPRYNPHGEMRVVRPRKHPSGYLYYGLFVGKGKTKVRYWRRGHRLVAEAFIGKIPQGMDVDHKDGNRHNNDVKNLRIVTHSENCLAGYERRNKQKK
jgi:hypothetical protein